MILPEELSAGGRALLAQIMRERVIKISREIAKLEDERADILKWLVAHDSEAEADE